MATTMWQPGRRLFSTASVLMILTAAAHTAGQLSPPSDPAVTELLAAMENLRRPLGLGMNASMLDLLRLLGFTMTVTFVGLGSINLLLAGSPDTTPGLLRRISWANVAWVGAFLALSFFYQIPPPFISAVIIELVLLASLLLPPRGSERTAPRN